MTCKGTVLLIKSEIILAMAAEGEGKKKDTATLYVVVEALLVQGSGGICLDWLLAMFQLFRKAYYRAMSEISSKAQVNDNLIACDLPTLISISNQNLKDSGFCFKKLKDLYQLIVFEYLCVDGWIWLYGESKIHFKSLAIQEDDLCVSCLWICCPCCVCKVSGLVGFALRLTIIKEHNGSSTSGFAQKLRFFKYPQSTNPLSEAFSLQSSIFKHQFGDYVISLFVFSSFVQYFLLISNGKHQMLAIGYKSWRHFFKGSKYSSWELGAFFIMVLVSYTQHVAIASNLYMTQTRRDMMISSGTLKASCLWSKVNRLPFPIAYSELMQREN